MAEWADAFGDAVKRLPLLGLLIHQHKMQGIEQRPRHVPVKVMRHQVQRIRIGKHVGKLRCHGGPVFLGNRSEEHTSELQSLMRISYAVFCLKKKKKKHTQRKNK